MENINFDPSTLTELKRPELQKLAKSVGVKANAKTVVIIQQLQEYYNTNGIAGMPDSPAVSPGVSEQSFKLIVPQECPENRNPEELAEAIIDEMRRKTQPAPLADRVSSPRLTPRRSVLSRDSISSMKSKMNELEQMKISLTPRRSARMQTDMDEIQKELNKRVEEKKPVDRRSQIMKERGRERKKDFERAVKERGRKIKEAKTPNFERIHNKQFSRLQSVSDYNEKIQAKKEVEVKKTRLPRVAMLANNHKVAAKREKNDVVKAKPKFDLKASLARKLTYKPYRGTIKKINNDLPTKKAINENKISNV